ncbi:XRE family transcriptional regulator [Chryseobacterium sp. T16E-39]|uniref:XRE family transcriptional regulator n=1 Tax=Chryseobacterium sp. T16E-39 TaxID=2015076 RepID=UPI000B5B2F56|nr:LexA family transcriptional regulator [Chryseobacterium sp. T16E-39]ASK29285.1 XRE family transcriptional regulator [Chryseobacterium sp. T16E-39]
MSILAENIRYLRYQLKLSQQAVADQLLITRGRYAKYEDGASQPPIELLIKMSRYYRISIDLMVTIDLRKYPLDDIVNLPDNRIVLPVVVDQTGNNSIEIIPQKASMGYLSGYTDPGYIESLQNISLPFLTNGKYRAFPVEGDSMPPFKDGSYIVGKYIEKTEDLKADKTYVFVTLNDGITYKRFKSRKENTIHVAADNSFYEPYDILANDLLEIWEYACSVSMQEFENEGDTQNVKEMFLELRKEIKALDYKFSKK